MISVFSGVGLTLTAFFSQQVPLISGNVFQYHGDVVIVGAFGPSVIDSKPHKEFYFPTSPFRDFARKKVSRMDYFRAKILGGEKSVIAGLFTQWDTKRANWLGASSLTQCKPDTCGRNLPKVFNAKFVNGFARKRANSHIVINRDRHIWPDLHLVGVHRSMHGLFGGVGGSLSLFRAGISVPCRLSGIKCGSASGSQGQQTYYAANGSKYPSSSGSAVGGISRLPLGAQIGGTVIITFGAWFVMLRGFLCILERGSDRLKGIGYLAGAVIGWLAFISLLRAGS